MTVRKARILSLGAVLASLTVPTVAALAQDDSQPTAYFAFAVGWNNHGYAGVAADYDIESAKEEAKRQCNHDGCTVVLQGGPGCYSAAMSGKKVFEGWARGEDRAEAIEGALEMCRERASGCKTEFTECI